MYNLPHFKEPDKEVVKEFLRQHSFAMVIALSSTYPVVTQIPLLIEETNGQLFFTGHIMRQTDHYKAFEQNPNVLCVFTGPHSYVSASWYANPQVASTWNYISVHAKGVLQFLDEEGLQEVLQNTTAHFENNDQSPASYHHLSTEYINRLSKAIVAFRIEVKEIETVFKLSQNRNEKDYESIIRQLEKREGDAQQIADEMEKRKSRLFNEKKP